MASSQTIIKEEEFIRKVCDERRSGLGFVPLVGAGLSAASGVPLIVEIQKYLQKCIALAMGLDRITDTEPLPLFHTFWRWHPQRDEWPPIHTGQAYYCDGIDWQARIGRAAAELTTLAANRSDAWKEYPEVKVFLEAYGATAEWRSSLNFLARLREKNVADGRELSLGAIDPHVIDNFFLNTVLGKTPTLGHKMLARLANPLGVNTIITLNFEDLIEQAFQEVQNPLTVYAVHQDAGLPAYHSKFGKNVLIKMHGDRYGLRADYSLDEVPSEEECRHFTSYLADQIISPKDWDAAGKADAAKEKLRTRNHLFVVGLAVQEERILQMIGKAKDVLDDTFQVFWIVYKQDEVAAAKRRLGQIFGEEGERFTVIAHHVVGLMFYNLYQNLTGALPPDAAVFPSQARVPVPPSNLKVEHLEPTAGLRVKAVQNRIDGEIDACFATKAHERNRRKLIIAHSYVEKYYGIVSAGSLSFSAQLDRGRQAIWIDLEEVTCADELFEVLLHTIARKAGAIDWIPVLAQSGPNDLGMSKADLASARQQELARLTHNPDREWVIYLNARSGGAGANFISVDSYEAKNKDSGPNGWLDRREISQSRDKDHPATDSGAEFVQLIDGFCREQCPNISLVLLCYKHPESLCYKPTVSTDLAADFRSVHVDDSCFGRDADTTSKVTEEALKWIIKPPYSDEYMAARRRFLFACASVNRVRSPTLLWSWAFHVGSTLVEEATLQERKGNTTQWINELEDLHVVRVQAGGFVWIQSDVRRMLRKELREYYKENDKSIIARVHFGLADWYGQLHVSSRSSRAATEVAYHQCIRARFLLESLGEEYDQQHSDEVTRQVLQALGAALRVLRQGRPSMLSDGFTQGTCRRLEDLRSKQCLEKIVANVLDGDTPQDEKPYGKRKVLDADPDSKNTPNASKIESAIDGLIGITYSLNLEIAQEIGNHCLAFQRLEQFSCYQATHVRDQLKRLNQYASLGIAVRSTRFTSMVLDRVYQKAGYELAKHLATTFQQSKSRDEVSDTIRKETSQWLRKAAENSITSFVDSQYENQNFTTIFSGSDLKEKVRSKMRKKIAKLLRGENYRSAGPRLEDLKLQLAAGIVKTLQRHMQANICKSFYARVLKRRGKPYPNLDAAIKDPLVEAGRLYDLAIELNRAVQSDGLRHQESMAEGPQRLVARDNISGWFDDQQRLDTQHAVSLALTGDFHKAFRRLNEAESALVEVRGAHGMEQAIIDLHRAAMFQWQAAKVDDRCKRFRDNVLTTFGEPLGSATQVSVVDDAALAWAETKGEPESIQIEECRRRIIEIIRGQVENATDVWAVMDGVDPESLEQDDEKYQCKIVERCGGQIESVVQLWEIMNAESVLKPANGKPPEPIQDKNQEYHSHSFIEDSWQALDRAKPILERFRKNAWWTTWSFELRMKLVEYELFAAWATGAGKSLPYLGMNAVPSGIPTMLDGLLDNSRRIIRMDVYRLARIVESYSNCLLVLSGWRWQVLSSQATPGSTIETELSLALEARALHSREIRMANWLSNETPQTGRETCVIGGLQKLKKLFDARLSLAPGTRIAKHAEEYVRFVIEHADQVSQFSKVNRELVSAIPIAPRSG